MVLRTRDERNFEKVIQPFAHFKDPGPLLVISPGVGKGMVLLCHATPNKANAAIVPPSWSEKTRKARKALAKQKLSIDVVGPARLVCRRHADRPLTRRLWNPPSERLEGSGDDDPHG